MQDFINEKKGIIVFAFFIFLIISVSIAFISTDGQKEQPKKTISNTQTSNEVAEEIYEEPQGSKPVKVVTPVKQSQPSNTTSNKNNKKSNKKNNTSSSKTSNKEVPVSYFITEIDNDKIYAGNTSQVHVTIKPDNATKRGVTYSSSNSKIAKVSSSGKVTGVKAGTCYINVKLKAGGSTQIKIQIVARPSSGSSSSTKPSSNSSSSSKPSTSTSSKNSNTNKTIAVSSVKLSKTSLSLQVGKTSTLTATISPSNASNKSVTWSSSNTAVATVSGGKITAKKAGSATITVKTSSGGKTATCKVTVTAPVKNGWYTENGKKYYYKNGTKVKDAYVDYVYLNSNGVAQAKIGSFSATLYGARAWANQSLNIRKTASQNGAKVGTIPAGGKMTILSAENSSTKYIKVKYSGTTGYVYSNYIYINLPDVIPDAIYEISNANKSIFKSADKKIPNVTGKNLYGFTKAKNNKIGKTTYYAPLLYPVAKQFQKAYTSAVKKGYNLKIYDTYRPKSVSTTVNNNFKNLYNSNSAVKKAVNYDKSGVYWGTSWFLANSISNHNRGIALDLTLTNSSGKELSAQSKMHTLDTRSLRKYNNSVANTLSSIMTSAGFETLASEWWHFEETNYKSSVATSIKIK